MDCKSGTNTFYQDKIVLLIIYLHVNIFTNHLSSQRRFVFYRLAMRSIQFVYFKGGIHEPYSRAATVARRQVEWHDDGPDSSAGGRTHTSSTTGPDAQTHHGIKYLYIYKTT